MKLVWTSQAVEDFEYWQSHVLKLRDRILALLASIAADPFTGIGKPEPLKHLRQGYWSRRIDKQHRLLYRVEGDPPVVTVAQCRYHY
jgi:toxin YoeB